MTAVLIQTIARAFVRLITLISARCQIVRAVVWAALIVSASEATAQQPTEDTSANAVFLGCKAFVDGRVTNAQLNADTLEAFHNAWPCKSDPRLDRESR
jgi:hypothetical protein